MHQSLGEIKTLRKKHGLTQGVLASQSGVSQSMVAKIEAGKVDPSYTTALRIFEVLDRLTHSAEKKAKELARKKLIMCHPQDEIRQVIDQMKKHGISQLPVMEHDHVVGMVSESVILSGLLDKHVRTVREIMLEPPPIVGLETPSSVVYALLKHFPMVLVGEGGKIVGVITKSDVLGAIEKS